MLAPAVRRRGCFTRREFLEFAAWKSPRALPRCRTNEDAFVRAVTATALATPSDRLRIEVLRLLNGVDWPTASVLLHFAHADPYPILDVRALWTLGVSTPLAYSYDVWSAYTARCRALAAQSGLSMRDLDRALWQYSKSRQGGGA